MRRARRGWAIAGSIAIHAGIGAWMIAQAPRAAVEQRAQLARVEVTTESVRFEPKRAPVVTGGVASPGPAASRGVKPASKSRPVTTPAAGGMGSGEGPSMPGGSAGSGSERADDGSVIAPRDLASIDLSVRPTPDAPAADPAAPTRLPGGGRSPVPGVDLRPTGDGSLTHTEAEFRARIEYDGTVQLEGIYEGPSLEGKNGPRIAFPMDATDTLLRMYGEDPYAYEKRKFMNQTRELRNAMADAACTERLQDAVRDIRPRLEAVWKSEKTIAQKKRTIFALWDECAEDGSPEVLLTATQIRESILAFIAEKMPASSQHAYTRGELALLNETRHSRAIFAPY